MIVSIFSTTPFQIYKMEEQRSKNIQLFQGERGLIGYGFISRAFIDAPRSFNLNPSRLNLGLPPSAHGMKLRKHQDGQLLRAASYVT
ncbi:MAG: hypothetical protein KGO02_24940 [Alphaproteobacteria bacterium]|nr:hypothetical protein [Alphaproteobacteria bacterium]